MNYELATLSLTFAVLVLQGMSMYNNAQIKLWAIEKFVSKAEYDRVKHD